MTNLTPLQNFQNNNETVLPSTEPTNETLENLAKPATPQSQTPTLEPGQSVICQMAPGKFDAFIKVLSLMDDKGIINIENSQICQNINNNTAILHTTVASLVGTEQLNLHILSPKKYLNAFKAIKNNSDVFIIDDTVNSRFIVRSGSIKLWLPKQLESFSKDAQAPDINKMEPIGTGVTIHKEERNAITALMRESNNITLLVHQQQLKGFSIPEMLEAPFKMFEDAEVSEANCEKKFTSYSFLCIPTDSDTNVYLAKLDDNYWLISKINTAIIDITVMEPINIAEDALKL